MRSSKAVAGMAMALLLTGGSAAAEEVEAPANPWAGSVFIYEHTFSAISLDKSAEQTWNPYYAHSLSLQPAWKFLPLLSVKGRVDVEQELTNSDDTTKRYQWMWSDLLLTVGTGEGYTEPTTGLKVTGGVRFTLPTSLESHARTLILGVGPGAMVSREFAVLGGLTVGYNARWTYNFNEEKDAIYDRSPVQFGRATSPDSPRAQSFMNTGVRNTEHSLLHGVAVDLSITDKLTFSTTFSFTRAALYQVNSDREVALMGDEKVKFGSNDVSVRHGQWFTAEFAYQAIDLLGVSLGVSSLYGDLASNGQYRTPFFNRFSNIYLDLSLDIDSIVNRL